MLDFKKTSDKSTIIGSSKSHNDPSNLLESDYSAEMKTDNLANYPTQTDLSITRSSAENLDRESLADSSSRPEVVDLENRATQPDKYRDKYLELLNRQLTIIREQKQITEVKPQPLAVAYPRPASTPATSKKPKKRFDLVSSLAFWSLAALIPMAVFWGLADQSLVYGLEENIGASPQVAGVSEKKDEYFDELAYEAWINQHTGLSLPAQGDLDEDGLTNGEEFLLETNPKNSHTCGGEKTDLENILNLTDPVSCQELDLEQEGDAEKFAQVIHVPTVAQKLFAFQDLEEEVKPVGNSLYEVFGVKNLNQIDYTGEGELKREIELSKKREEYSKIMQNIDQYIANNRSYEEYDRNYATPVGAAVFLETSIEYDAPLKYVLTIARLESRFGTDRYTKSGNLTRPGAHQNMYSIGLDDSGNNRTYGSWEEGVYAFGRWYRYFDDKGVPDCQKWRIYNPNGDYCAKVEQYAAEIEAYVYGGS